MHFSKYKIFYFINTFNPEHILKLKKNIRLIFRNYKNDINLNFYKKIKNFCHSNGFRIYLGNNINLAHNLGFDGVYLPAFNKKFIRNRNFRINFEILGSAHNLKEIRQKEVQGAKYIFLSPIFFKKYKKSLGLIRFKNLSKNTNIHIVALGGVNGYNLNKLKLIEVKNFASISFIRNFYGK